MNQTERITYYETLLDQVREELAGMQTKKDASERFGKRLQELDEYYGSVIWFQDYNTDLAGELPADLKRGVLTEDGIYDVLMDYQELPEG